MFAPHKNSYLQTKLGGVNPRLINRVVNRAREQPTTDESDLDPPFFRLTSEQPCIPIENVDVTRRPLAFGRWAMPKLRKELHSKDPDVVSHAVNSICDLVHDPERGYEAIKLRVPARMADMLSNDDDTIRERVCMALTTMAGLYQGKKAIVKNQLMVSNIALVVEDLAPPVRMKAAALVEMLARVWMTADELIENGFITILLENVQRDENPIIAIHLLTLRHLMYGEGKDQALEQEAFRIFVDLMESEEPVIRSRAADCLMMVTSCIAGKELAYDEKLLNKLNVLLHEEDPDVYTSAASAIMFCTIKSRAKFRAREIPNLAKRLVALTNNWHHPSAQIFSIKALTNMCEHPAVRKYVILNHREAIENIIVGKDEDMQRYKNTLHMVLMWLPESAD